MGHGAKSEAALEELIEKYSDTEAAQVAKVYAARSEVDAAFDWLERAFAQRDSGLIELKTTPHVRSLHGDARWGTFMKKMGLED